MPIQTGDIRFARSAIMADVDNGGGPPTAQLIPDGASNAIFPDISEDARTGGLVEVRHIHGVLRNTDTDALLGANVIVAEPPDDDNVSITLIKSPSTFARRPDLVKLIEATSTPGSEFNGFLLENHVAGQRSLQIGQRPGVTPPGVNTSLVLVQDEGLVTEYSQFVRVRRVTVSEEDRTAADAQGNPVDFKIQIAACELFSPLSFDFPGSPPSKFYARTTGKTKTRSVTVNDAGTFFSASRLTAPVLPADQVLFLDSVYTQIVPNTKTETPLLNQRPGGTHGLQLVDSVGTTEVTDSVHTARIFVTEANQGNSFVTKLTPPPAPGSVTASFLALGAWSAVVDDGAGALGGGPGAGTVLYSTGDVSLTTEALPDYNSFIIFTWASTAPYINNVAGGPVVLTELPSFDLTTQQGAAVDGATITWLSASVARTASVNAVGVISGDAIGLLASGLGKTVLTTQHLPDPGSNFVINYQSRPVTSVSSAAFNGGEDTVTLALPSEPMPGTVKAVWNARTLAGLSSGVDMTGTSSGGSLSTSHRRTLLSVNGNAEVVRHEVVDNGAGAMAESGSVDYAGRSVTLDLQGGVASVLGYQSDLENTVTFAATLAQIKAA